MNRTMAATRNKIKNNYNYPIDAKVGRLQSQGAKGEAVVNLLQTLGNAGSGVLRLSRRVNNMTKSDPIILIHQR
jgi:hypothetical protein